MTDPYNAFTFYPNTPLQRDTSSLESRTLAGILVAVKDNIDVETMPTSAGTPVLRDAVPTKSATAVDTLLANGGIIAGKTNMHELALGITSKNHEFGFVSNPLDRTCVAGGSSGGSAAAVAARLVDAALGTDTAGSVRIPASFCGCVGFRPSIGRYPSDGVIPLVRSRDTIGILTRSVAMTEAVDTCLSGIRNDADSQMTINIRIGVPRDFRTDNLSPEIERQFKASLSRLKDGGVTVVQLPDEDIYSRIDALASVATAFEIRRDLCRAIEERITAFDAETFLNSISSPDVSTALRGIFQGPSIGRAEYQATQDHGIPAFRDKIHADMDAYEVDFIAFPTTPTTAYPLDLDNTIEIRGQSFDPTMTAIRNMQTASLAGLPSISLPMTRMPDVLPGGLTLEARKGEDSKLLLCARVVEGLL